MKYLSSGGLGDAFIILLKLEENALHNKGMTVDWTHVESNDIQIPLKHLFKYFRVFIPTTESINIIHDPDYVRNIREYIKDRIVIPTPVRGKCNFYQKEWPLKNPFLEPDSQEKEYDIVLQCSAGTNDDRDWLQDPFRIAEALASTGRHVTIVGTDERFKGPSKNPEKIINLVGRTTLTDVFDIIERCEVFIGHSGLLTFFSMASKIPTIHCQHTEEANKNYIHEMWAPYFYNIKYGSLSSVIKELNKI